MVYRLLRKQEGSGVNTVNVKFSTGLWNTHERIRYAPVTIALLTSYLLVTYPPIPPFLFFYTHSHPYRVCETSQIIVSLNGVKTAGLSQIVHCYPKNIKKGPKNKAPGTYTGTFTLLKSKNIYYIPKCRQNLTFICFDTNK